MNEKVINKYKLQIKIITDKNIELQQKIDKAIEFIEEVLSSTKGVLNDYMYHKEHNKILIELLKEDELTYIKLLEILGDKE